MHESNCITSHKISSSHHIELEHTTLAPQYNYSLCIKITTPKSTINMRERDSKMGNIRDGSQQAMRASMNYQGGLLIIPNCQSLFKKKNKLPITNGRDSEAP